MEGHAPPPATSLFSFVLKQTTEAAVSLSRAGGTAGCSINEQLQVATAVSGSQGWRGHVFKSAMATHRTVFQGGASAGVSGFNLPLWC